MDKATVNVTRDWDVLGVGDADVDIFLKVERLPGRDEKVLAEFLGEHPGGMVANFCCAASQLGSRTALATVVGDDRYGAMAIADLHKYGVDTTQVRVRAGGQTYFCVSMLDGTGEKALTVVSTDCIAPRRADVDPSAFGRARLVHLIADDLDMALWVASEARSRGAMVSLDIEPTTISGSRDFETLLGCVELAFPNQAGLAALFGAGEPVELAHRLLEKGPKVVVVTGGARGCLILTGTETLRLPAFQVPVVDTTGAGDCFNGAFVTGYLKGWDLERCGRFATGAAALSITGIGSRSALPSADDVERFLLSRPWTGPGPS